MVEQLIQPVDEPFCFQSEWQKWEGGVKLVPQSILKRCQYGSMSSGIAHQEWGCMA